MTMYLDSKAIKNNPKNNEDKSSVSIKPDQETMDIIRNRQIIERNPNAIIVTDPGGIVKIWNNGAERIYKHKKEEVVGRSISILFKEQDYPFLESLMTRLKQGENIDDVELTLLRKDKAEVEALFTFLSIRNSKNEVVEFVGISRNISIQDPAEKKINDMTMQKYFEMSSELICQADINTATFTMVSPGFKKTLGYDEKELLSKSFLDFVHPDDKDRTLKVIDEQLQKGKKVLSFINRYRCKDGSYIVLDWNSHPVPEEGFTYAVARDVTKQKEVENKLLESEKRLRSYVDHAPYGIFVTDEKGRYIGVNQAACKITGYSEEELLKMNFLDLTPGNSREIAREHFNSLQYKKHATIEVEFIRKDKKVGWWTVSAVSLSRNRYLGFVNDVTETKRLRELESRASRLEAAGTIAGQVAHDFNNLLGPIVAYPEFIREKLAADNEAVYLLDQIELSAQKISDINQDLLTMGRRGHYNQEILDLNQLVSHTVDQIKTRSDNVIIKTDLDDNLMAIKGGSAQLQRMLINILANAYDAMQDKGTITIKTENFYADETSIAYGCIPKGEYVRMTVTDTGCGIADEIKNRILDPFFTTKLTDRERGSGLGMSVVDSVLKDHDGYLDLSSVVGEGTSFFIYFPICRENHDEIELISEISHGSGSVLVVDDDDNQREVTTLILRKLGYDVNAVESGEKALDFLENNSADLLILDMIMPNSIDGVETFRQAKEINPDQQAIIISGFAENDRIIEAKNLGLKSFIRKPFTKATLAKEVRWALQQSALAKSE